MTFSNITLFRTLTSRLYTLLTGLWAVVLVAGIYGQFPLSTLCVLALSVLVMFGGIADYETTGYRSRFYATLAPVILGILLFLTIIRVHSHEPLDTVGWSVTGFMALHFLLALMVYLSNPARRA